MADATLGTVLRHLRRLAAPPPGADLSDGQLLDGFLGRRDESAFAALLSRHGPMVLGVCRRVLRHAEDADDAFQATFLVLVRQAGSIRRHDSLASYLYGVALRTARRAKLDAARRRRREERAAAPLSAESTGDDWRDLRAVLDEEIAGLPEKYREPLLLCHLEGHTNAQAARHLRVPLGSLSKRLARARGLLRGRLMRRGVVLSAAALLTVLAGQAGAAVPPLLARTATGTALLALAGGAGVAAPVAVLADGVSRALFAGQVKAWLIGFAVFGFLIAGGLFVGGQFGGAPPSDDAPGQPAPAAPPENEAPRRDPDDLDAIKRRLLRRGGGNAKSEAAVAAGLLWLAKEQANDGRWSLDGSGGMRNDTAGTAFGLLPFLGAGHTHKADKDPFAKNVGRGLDFLIAHQGKNGDLGGSTYAHALASSALCQAYALSGDAKLAAPARNALKYIVKAQHEDGGWRYTPGQPGDLSVTAWQVAALHDARAAGLDVPRATFDGAVKFLQSCRTRDGGWSYVPLGQTTVTMTAAGLVSGARLGDGADAADPRAAAALLTKTAPGTIQNVYYHHWATLALWRQGGEDWEKWNGKMRDLLVSRQEADGGWPAKGEVYGPAGGRLMVSSLSLLVLEVYYRDDLPFAAAASRSLKGTEVESAWSDLAAADPVKARRGAWALAGSPKQTLPLLKEALAPRPLPSVDDKQVAQRIAELDDDDFEVRDKASAALAKLGKAAEPALRKARKHEPASAETRRRLESLLSKIEGARFTPEHRRALRAIEVLELVGTSEAEKILKRLAKESPDADLAEAAKAALARWADSAEGRP